MRRSRKSRSAAAATKSGPFTQAADATTRTAVSGELRSWITASPTSASMWRSESSNVHHRSGQDGRKMNPPVAPFLVMGVVNVTPDSFSDGGRYLDAQAAIAHGRLL